jgi:hypothetical protein
MAFCGARMPSAAELKGSVPEGPAKIKLGECSMNFTRLHWASPGFTSNPQKRMKYDDKGWKFVFKLWLISKAVPGSC